MPKKQPRNAYYFYMLDFKEEQRKKGIHYQNLSEVQVAADPSWRSAPPKERAKYEEMAKREKQRVKGRDKKYTSTGIPISEIESQQRRALEMEEAETEYIRNYLKLKSVHKTIHEDVFYIIDVNAYCSTGDYYLMAECTVLRFNLIDGIKDFYHEMINPGRIPIGYASDVKLGAQELGLEMPDEETRPTDYMIVLANLMDYLKQDKKAKGSAHIPPLYTLPEKTEMVQNFIAQLCMVSGEDDSQLRVYKLDNLFFYLVNEIKLRDSDGYPKMSLATAQLKKDPFKYTPRLGCERHEAGDKGVECTRSRAHRWAYAVLDKCCAAAALRAAPGAHLPANTHLESVLTYKEQKREEIEALLPGNREPLSSNASMLTDSIDNSVNSTLDRSRGPKRRHEPLRMPKTDYSQTIRPAPAPELNEWSLRAFSSTSSGAGRGRGLVSNFNAMSINK